MKLYDVGIVGGGFSGLYTVYRLTQKNPNLKIAVIEKSSRLGGRIYTKQVGNHIQEYGPMRFELQLQPRFANLLTELDINTKPFSGYTAQSDKLPDLNKLSFEEVQAIMTNRRQLPPAFALLKYAIAQILGDQWDLDGDNICDPARPQKKKWLLKHGLFQGRLLHKHGLWDTLAHVLCKEAIDYIREDGTFYHMIHTNPNAANHVIFILDMLATQKLGLVTIDGGSMRLIDTIYDKISHKFDIMIDSHVSHFTHDEHGVIGVHIQGIEQKIINCKHLILTCPKNALKTIGGFDQKTIDLFNSVVTVNLFKIFVVLDNPPWDETSIPKANTHAHLVPCREVHYDYDIQTKTGMIMLYGDEPTLNYWSPFCQNHVMNEPEENANPHLLNHLNHYIRKLFPGNQHSVIIKHYSIMDWSRPPSECGVHMWRPGFLSEDIIKELISVGEHQNVHVCGEAYSCYQGFIEGCITSVDTMLDRLCN